MEGDGLSLETDVHQALASPVRMQVVTVLRATDAGMDVRELAETTGLHVNTVRDHLNRLVDAGLVACEPEGRDRPGRPRLVYRATALADDSLGGHGYRFLALVLAGYLASIVDDPAAASDEAGRAWGRHMVVRAEPFRRLDGDAALERVGELLTELGFAPEIDATDAAAPQILLRRCPFLDVARDHQEVVCSMHLGLMRGALDELGAELEATVLLPFVEPSLCVTQLAVRS